MRVLATVIIAIVLLLPYVPADAASDDTIGIDSIDELMGIGTTLPSDGNYILLKDIVLHTDRTLDVGMSVVGDDMVLTVTTEGYSPSDTVDGLTIVLNGHRMVSNTYPTVSFPLSTVMGSNVMSVELDGWHAMTVLDPDEFVDGNTVVMDVGQDIRTIPVTFTGTLDGLGHRISGIDMVGDSGSLFSSSNGATFRNLTIEGTFASMTSEMISSNGHLSSDMEGMASALVSVASDTVFERISVISDVISFVSAEYTLEQGGEDGRSLSTQCARDSVSGGIVAKSTGCDFIACSVSGHVVSSVGSELSMEAHVTPSLIDTFSETAFNRSVMTVGGISGISENDRFAFCDSRADVVSICQDVITSDSPMAGFDTDDRVQSGSYMGGISGMMTGSYVYGCSDHGERRDTYIADIRIPGIYTHTGYDGSVCGSSNGCVFDTCLVSGETSASSVSDDLNGCSKDTVVPDCTFGLSLENDTDVVFEGIGDSQRTMDGRHPIIGSVGDGEDLVVECKGGNAVLIHGRMVMNPTFDWSVMIYKDMTIEVREEDEPVSAELIVLLATCAVAVTLVVFTVRSLGRL